MAPTDATDDSTRLEEIAAALARLAAASGETPGVTVGIPVNAQGDLENVLRTVADVSSYAGKRSLELVLAVNNFEPDEPPREALDRYRRLGIRVTAKPDARVHGEAIGLSARVLCVREARSQIVILFDADCRLIDATALIDWYADRFDEGADAAYTRVDHYGYEPTWDLRLHFAVHHLARWTKRVLFRIPTTRGSNYAVRRDRMLELYERGLIADEMNVGPSFKSVGSRIAYSGAKRLRVLTSGRMFKLGFFSLLPYYRYRLRYNLRVLPVREGVAELTGREHDPIRRYVDNKRVS